MKLLVTVITILSFVFLPQAAMAMEGKKVQTEQSVKAEKKEEVPQQSKKEVLQQSKKETLAGGGCCQCKTACQDVTRASQCRGLCGPGGGAYKAGKSCKRNTCK